MASSFHEGNIMEKQEELSTNIGKIIIYLYKNIAYANDEDIFKSSMLMNSPPH